VEPLITEQQRDLREIVEQRYNAGSLVITSQVPIAGTTSSATRPRPTRSSTGSSTIPTAPN